MEVKFSHFWSSFSLLALHQANKEKLKPKPVRKDRKLTLSLILSLTLTQKEQQVGKERKAAFPL